MPLRWLGVLLPANLSTHYDKTTPMRVGWLAMLSWLLLVSLAAAMTPDRIAELRQETVSMFYHGFDNYMNVAFPEDELRPVTCAPLTRDNQNPKHIELNDVLGNYSLTLIDSLSTLAILASSPPDIATTSERALHDFQTGVEALVLYYGDGSSGPAGKGIKARGFDLDSKVQVFETVIRGVGGLLSAHSFASGILPITTYDPQDYIDFPQPHLRDDQQSIRWPTGFVYDGQLLRLATDLAQRLLPAFYTNTGLPYPRVNLKYGIPFYQNSPLHKESEREECTVEDPPEITETCSAGAGSLVLEFTTLSRLTGDLRFEQLAKRAFWAVWNRRSNIGLLGAGVDAEEGHWVGPYAGIGAGTDSFFEYALKAHILLSGHDVPNTTTSPMNHDSSWLDPNTIYPPLSLEENSPDAFLNAWIEAHAAIKRHLYSGAHHPHYVNVHLSTGSPQAYWVDSLGAYYPGLLTLAGELDEAIETNLLYTALWTRYAALPERWSVREGHVEGGLGWWPGRPEFIESNYYLYRATKDPWYLHVGEMVLKDIQRRCWTKCGWSGLQDVRTGEMSDRMESFFLGETAKYLYLLFDPSHPLNSLDAPYVFTTEGHPLLLPHEHPAAASRRHENSDFLKPLSFIVNEERCPVPPPLIPFTTSATAARDDLFHAASLTSLHLIPNLRFTDPEEDMATKSSQTYPNHTIYPWTLPTNLIPDDATCAKIPLKTTFTIEFPTHSQLPSSPGGFNIVLGGQSLVRMNDGILVKSLSGLKLGLVLDTPQSDDDLSTESWRIWSIGTLPLGRDEKVFISRETIGSLADPSFSRVRDQVKFDLIVQVEVPSEKNQSSWDMDLDLELETDGLDEEEMAALGNAGLAAEYRTILSSLLNHVTSALRDPAATLMPGAPPSPNYNYVTLPAIASTGIGAAPIPDVGEAPNPRLHNGPVDLAWKNIYFAGEGCDGKLPAEVVQYQLIVMRRGGCTFSSKLANIPSFAPSGRGLQLVLVISDEDEEAVDENLDEFYFDDLDFQVPPAVPYKLLSRPLLDEKQLTPAGIPRRHQLSMAMVGGGHRTEDLLRSARAVGLRRRYHVESQGLDIANLVVV